jgi:GST-like protein
MIDFYYWTTPNGHKVTLFLEESGIPYNIKPINISKGEQFAPDFLRIAPILLYLADKTKKFIPQDLRGRNECLKWLFWQMGGLGPMAGQNHHFVQYAPEQLPYAIDRYVKETSRLYGVLNKHLSDGRDYICGDYSIADMAAYPWVVPHERQRQDLSQFPALAQWLARIQNRPATKRSYEMAKTINVAPTVDEKAKSILFGQDAKTVS